MFDRIKSFILFIIIATYIIFVIRIQLMNKGSERFINLADRTSKEILHRLDIIKYQHPRTTRY